MIRLIVDNLDAIKDLCMRYRVLRLEVFGSALTGESFYSEQSDIDFLVDFLPLKQGQYADAYFGLLEALEELFDRHIDLVMPGAIKNPYFLESVTRNRKVLYAS